MNNSFARALRLRRLHRHGDHNLLVVPLDHSVTDGPIPVQGPVDDLVSRLAGSGVDAVVLHKGVLRYIDPASFTGTSLIVHLSASTSRSPDPDAKYLVASVEEALRCGADAVSVHVNLGSTEERTQVADLAAVAEACDRWNVPLLAMMYPRGPRIDNPRDPELVAHAVTLAAHLGADLVKTVYPGSLDAMADIARNSPIPVLVAGGPRRAAADDVLAYVQETLLGGACGVAMGRNIFEAHDPGAMARRISDLIHGPITATPTPTDPTAPPRKRLVATG